MPDTFIFDGGDFVRIFEPDAEVEIQPVTGGVDITIGAWSATILGVSADDTGGWLFWG